MDRNEGNETSVSVLLAPGLPDVTVLMLLCIASHSHVGGIPSGVSGLTLQTEMHPAAGFALDPSMAEATGSCATRQGMFRPTPAGNVPPHPGATKTGA